MLTTKPFGEIEIDSSMIYTFPEGILGFPEYNEFALLNQNEESAFHWLQSTIDTELAFVMMQPDIFFQNYEPELLPQDLYALKVKSLHECIIYTIITIPKEDPNKMTANLQGPVLFNHKENIGRQAISTHPTHTIRVPVLELLGK